MRKCNCESTLEIDGRVIHYWECDVIQKELDASFLRNMLTAICMLAVIATGVLLLVLGTQT